MLLRETISSINHSLCVSFLTHWGRVTHICVSKLTIIGSDNGLSPGRRQSIIWTSAGILLIWTLGTNLSETWSEIHAFSFKKMHLKRSSAKWRPFCLGLNVFKKVTDTACLFSFLSVAAHTWRQTNRTLEQAISRHRRGVQETGWRYGVVGFLQEFRCKWLRCTIHVFSSNGLPFGSDKNYIAPDASKAFYFYVCHEGESGNTGVQCHLLPQRRRTPAYYFQPLPNSDDLITHPLKRKVNVIDYFVVAGCITTTTRAASD